MTWEYRAVNLPMLSTSKAEEQLNELGAQGWELVSSGNSGVAYAILKRPKSN